MERVIEVEHLEKKFGNFTAVDHISFHVERGEIFGFLGANGAGKTTVFNMLTGVYLPTEGDFFLCGESLKGLHQEAINRKGIARTFQNIRLFNNMTVVRNVMVGLSNQPEYKCSLFESFFRLPRHFRVEKAMRERAKEILDIFGLLDERNNLACNLPYGKQRKLEIARALATKPRLLLLDEPAAGMNQSETAELMATIRLIRDKFDVTILLIEHDMKFVSGLCDEITVLNFGTMLATGTADEVLSNPEVIRAYLGN